MWGRYVEDTAAYSAGLYSTSEAVPAARQQRDSTLKRIMVGSLHAQLTHAGEGPDALLRTAQATANAACLHAAIPALERLTVLRARHDSRTLQPPMQLSKPANLIVDWSCFPRFANILCTELSKFSSSVVVWFDRLCTCGIY